MSATGAFWKRIESLFRPSALDRVGSSQIGFLAPRAKLGARADDAFAAATDSAGAVRSQRGAAGNGHADRSTGVASPWSRWRDRHAERREAQRRAAGLIEAMHAQLARQEARSARLIELIERIDAAMQSLAHTQTGQAGMLERICDRLEAGQAQAEKVAAAVRDLPQALRGQAEAVQAVSVQLEASRASDVTLIESLRHFEQATVELRESGATQVDTLNRMQMDSRQERAALELALRKQNRRLVLASVVCTVVGVAAVAFVAVQRAGVL